MIKKFLFAIALSPSFAFSLPDGIQQDWTFEHPEAVPLSVVENKVSSGSSFQHDIGGSSTTGDGTFRIRRALSETGAAWADLSAPVDDVIWLVVDIAGWNLVGNPMEDIHLGFFGNTTEDFDADGRADLVAGVSLRRVPVADQKDFRPKEIRTDDSAVSLRGDPHDPEAGAEFIEPRVLFWSSRRESPVRIVLKYDAIAHTYEILFRENGIEYVSFTQGKAAPGQLPLAVRVRALNAFNQRNEYFDIDRIFITTKDPTEGGPIKNISLTTDEPMPHLRTFAEMPKISARSWAVADGRTGEILHSHQLEAPRKIASITKTMAAYTVAQLILENPEILNENVSFSEAAIRTRGSSTGLAAGESLSMKDSLYGLMLPSGNDAGNALAEHFHDRLASRNTSVTSRSNRAHFVAEMNRQAQKLGMTHSIFRLPFGDGGTADDHTSSARDLLLLARAALDEPLLLKIVGTQTYTANVYNADDEVTPRTWTNTNRFLGTIDGFHGVKTGTTANAGACLLTSYQTGDRHYLMVVLGSSSSNHRYLDTLNILGWASQQDDE